MVFFVSSLYGVLSTEEVTLSPRPQIVYPAVEYKVQNVTHSYSVEHGEEVSLLVGSSVVCQRACNLKLADLHDHSFAGHARSHTLLL